MRSRASRSLLLALCCVLLLLRIVGVHQHLCLDGCEPHVAVHVLDGGVEHAAGHGQSSHDDQGIDDTGRTLIKSPHSDSAMDFMALILVLVTFLPVARRLRFERPGHRPATPAPHSVRPPPRGPPLALRC